MREFGQCYIQEGVGRRGRLTSRALKHSGQTQGRAQGQSQGASNTTTRVLPLVKQQSYELLMSTNS